METIRLQQALPEVFAHREDINSDVWCKELVFEKGKRYLIEAASGSGKSSLCAYLYGHRYDYQGVIAFDGQDIRTFDNAAWLQVRTAAVSYLFQELRLFPELTALENVLIKNRLTNHRTEEEIRHLFDYFGIGDKLNTVVAKLSFGQQQRVAFIRSLCQPFDFMILDEPVSHLDEQNNQLMADLLAEEAQRCGAGVIVTSTGKRLVLSYNTILRL